MIHAAASLARRGFEAYVSVEGDDKVTFELPGWATLMLCSTVALFFGVMFMIEYTFGRVVPTLLMIESPAEAIDFQPLKTNDPATKDVEQPFVPKPITASFRKTVRHLHAVGGFAARFRGFWLFVVQGALVQWIAGMISFMLPRSLANIVALVALSQLSLAWTQIVISGPSPKPWYRRLPASKTWKKVAGPTAILALSEQLAVFVPVYIAVATGMAENPRNFTPHQKSMLGVKALFLALLGLVLAIVFVIPAKVVLTRVQASLLPDSDETIVPFDRSFGGKVVPEIVGGDGVSLKDAWATFDWASRVRLVKAYAKVLAMHITVWVVFVVCICAQLFMVVGKDFSKLIPKDGKRY